MDDSDYNHNPFSDLEILRSEFPSLMTSDELLNLKLPPIKWAIKDLLPAGLSLLAGPPKIGKSYLLLSLAKDILKQGGSVFYFAGEDSRFLLQSRLRQLEIEPSDDLCLICGRDGSLAKPNEYLDKVDLILRAKEFDAVFLDNMEIVLPERSRQSDDYTFYYKHLPTWAEMAARYNSAIIMTHHTTKEVRDDPFKSILGSQAIMGSCDSVFVIERSNQSNLFNLHSTGKFSPDVVHSLKRDGAGFEFDGSAEEANLRATKGLHRLYELIKENPGIQQKEIVLVLEQPKGNVSRDIRKLIERGFIEGNPFEGYAVINTTDNLDNLDN